MYTSILFIFILILNNNKNNIKIYNNINLFILLFFIYSSLYWNHVY